ncbi:MAG: SatD family protein [Schumannella sp.]
MIVAGLIIDIVGSRALRDRQAGQVHMLETADTVAALVPAREPIAPTVGDEFQAVYATLPEALTATLVFRLALPEELDCRFGIGVGEDHAIRTGANVVKDGSAWWSAREAIERTRGYEKAALPSVRTQCIIAGGDSAAVNAYLISRDHIVSAMRRNTRRLLLGTLQGKTQTQMAKEYGITQGTISSNMRRGGPNAVLEGLRLMSGGTT